MKYLFLIFAIYSNQLYSQHFTINTNSNCDSSIVNFTNLNSSNNYQAVMFQTTGYSYYWDFGNGQTSTSENPNNITYNSHGTYIVNYSVTIDTIGFKLVQVDINSVNCNDPLGGKIDPYLIITDNTGGEAFNNFDNYYSNSNIPFSFSNIDLLLNAPPYFLRIWDYDSSDENDNCIDDSEIVPGSAINILLPANNYSTFGLSSYSGTSSNNLLSYTLHFEKQVYTFTQTDTIYIYETPPPPVLSYYNGNFCLGVEIPEISAIGNEIKWYSDNNLQNLIHTGNTFTVNENIIGEYVFYVTNTNINGCQSSPSVLTIHIGNYPQPIVINNNTMFCEGQILEEIYAIGENLKWYSDSLIQNLVFEGDTLPIQNTTPGNYTYFLTQSDSSNTCISNYIKVNYTINTNISASLETIDLTCYNSNNGAMFTNINSGLAPYTFLWSTNSTDSIITNLSEGEYSVIISDSKRCVKVLSAYIYSPSDIQINSNIKNISCYGNNDGEISVLINGGSPEYTYLWSNGELSNNINNLQEEIYTLTVVDANNCIKSKTFQITEPKELNVDISLKKEQCIGSFDGEINLTVSGGIPPYNYLWTGFVDDSIATNLTKGFYDVIVSDNNYCEKHNTIEISSVYDKCIIPASVITPNNDGKNDTWKILFIEMYSDVKIVVFDNNGNLVFQSNNYSEQWDGTCNGEKLPIGSYFYNIKLNKESEDIIGVVDIIY